MSDNNRGSGSGGSQLSAGDLYGYGSHEVNDDRDELQIDTCGEMSRDLMRMIEHVREGYDGWHREGGG